MSTKRGNFSRTRPQKYTNRVAFKNDLHDKTPQIKMINSLQICEVCLHCKAVIEWKIKYKKYKPLTKPKTCVKCQSRTIKKAYHVICRYCAIKENICAKCLKSGNEVSIEPPVPTDEEQIKLKVEMEKLIKSFSERKRRAFLRYMKKGKSKKIAEEDVEEENNENIDESSKHKNRIPYSREDLLKKIEELQLNDNDDEEDDYFFDSSDCDSDNFGN